MSEKLLTSVAGNVEMFLYEGILKENDIPYYIKHKGMDGYLNILRGPAHNQDADIYVSDEDYEQAVKLTEIIRTEPNQAPDNPDNPTYGKKKIFAWMIAGLFFVLIIITLTRMVG